MAKRLKDILNNRFLGAFLGALLPILTLIFINMDYNKHLPITEFLEKIHKINRLSALLSLCSIPNMFVFFLFLRREYYKTVWGIMFSMVLLLVLVFVLFWI